MERAMSCRTEEDIRRLFCIEASDYWRTHHISGDRRATNTPSGMGAFKANIIGINLVSVLQFAYGSVHRAAKRCATAPSRCSNACQPRTTVTCATGATRAL